MLAYTITSMIILLFLTAIAMAILIRILTEKNRIERINYVRNFKKGQCLAVYILALPLYFIGYLYARDASTTQIVDIAVSTTNDVRDLVILKYRFTGIRALMRSNLLYTATVYWCAFLVFCNAFLFLVSVGQQYMWEKHTCRRFEMKKCRKYIFIGRNEENKKLFRSVKKGLGAVVDYFSKDDLAELYKEGIVHFQEKDVAAFAGKYLRKALKGVESPENANRLYIVVNTGDDGRNIEICQKLSKELENLSQTTADLFRRVNIYVYGNTRYESLYARLMDKSGCIRVVDKYKTIATDFVADHPLSLDMTEEMIDMETCLVKDGVDINVIMIGFGDINQQIFLMYIATNQFIQKTQDGVGIKQVHYHIFDKGNVENNKNMNYSYHRYRNEFFRYDKEKEDYVPKVDQSKYLPLAELPAKESFYPLDINSPLFFETIKKILDANPKGINQFMVAFGGDLENFDLAQKIYDGCLSWRIRNFRIFARAREKSFDPMDREIIFFGNEEKALYDIEEIDDGRLLRMALRQNRIYQEEYAARELRREGGDQALTPQQIREIDEKADRKWFLDFNLSKRESSMYAILSIRSKLLMMGLDYVGDGQERSFESAASLRGTEDPADDRQDTADGRKPLNMQEYLDWYAKGDLPEFDKTASGGVGLSRRGGIEFAEGRPKNMAIQEHFRWNAYMISRGIVPAPIKVILEEKNENGKYTNGNNYVSRHHGNLTTFEGLETFRDMVAERDGSSRESADVIHYDYQIMDDACWMLDKMGYKIIRRT